jgi:O-antigen/teichoic acid export membrane protein
MTRTLTGTPGEEQSDPKPRFWSGHLVQNAVALMVSSGGTAVLGIAFWTTAAHLTSAENIGRGSAEIAAMTLLANLSQLSFGSIFDRFLPRAGNGTRALVTRAYGLCTVVALAVAVAYLLAGFGHNFIPQSLGWHTLFVVAVILWTIFVLQDSVLTGLRATRWVPVENILFALAKLALLPLGLLLTLHQGVFLAWSVPVLGATGGVSWYLFRKAIPRHEEMNPSANELPSAREIVSLSFAQYAQSLLGVFSPSIVALIVIARLGPIAEARYYVPALISSGVALFLWNLNTSFLVEASRDPSALRQHANITIRTGLIVILPTVGIGEALAPELLRIFGASYAAHSTTLLRLLLLTLPSTAVTAFYAAFAWLDKRIWKMLVRDLVAGAAYFTILLILIGHLGILAIGITSLVTATLQGIFFLPLSIKRYRSTARTKSDESDVPKTVVPDVPTLVPDVPMTVVPDGSVTPSPSGTLTIESAPSAAAVMVVDPSAPQPRTGRIFYPWDILLPASIVFWVSGIKNTDVAHLGLHGLPTILPIVFYVGVGLLVVSIGWALSQARLSPIRLGANLGALLLMLYGTAPLVYQVARYAWVYKYIGVVQYVNLHGRLNTTIDIYQNWPGFFAFTAWFDKVLGVQSPLAYAKWAQLAFELLTCLMLYYVFRGLPLTDRERWLALFLYAGSIWIAQDYLSAQALGVVLSTGIFALTLNFLRRETQAKWVLGLRNRLQPIGRLIRRSALHSDNTDALVGGATSRTREAFVLVAITLVYFVLTFEHELSPYVVLIQLGALAIIGEVRRRWIALLFAVVALGYFAPHFAFVNQHFGLLASIGNFFGNAAPPSAGLGTVTVGVRMAEQASHYLSVFMWGLSALGALRRWRNGRPTLALVLLAYSPVFVFFAGAYGDEALLRVYLFSLPWTACLAASAIKPVGFRVSKLAALRAPFALAIAVTLFFPAFFGNDYSNVMTPGEVQGTLSFYRTASPGTVFAVTGNFPQNVSGRYNLFGERDLYGTGGVLELPHPVTSNAAEITRIIRHNTLKPEDPSYILVSPAMLADGIAYGFLTRRDLQDLTKTLNNAPGWIQVYDKGGVTAYELPPS